LLVVNKEDLKLAIAILIEIRDGDWIFRDGSKTPVRSSLGTQLFPDALPVIPMVNYEIACVALSKY
jgi:hypothetical protein